MTKKHAPAIRHPWPLSDDGEVARIHDKLDAILVELRHLRHQERHIMSTVKDVKDLVAALDIETNAVAAKVDAQTAKIADLVAQLAAGSPVTAADLDAIAAGLQPISDRLTALGADAANPIPK